MIQKTILFGIIMIIIGGCVNKHGISMNYYSDCQEYYDYQGGYHKECGQEDIITYKEIKKRFEKKQKDPNLIEGIPSNF